jgi:hypothetical protein
MSATWRSAEKAKTTSWISLARKAWCGHDSDWSSDEKGQSKMRFQYYLWPDEGEPLRLTMAFLESKVRLPQFAGRRIKQIIVYYDEDAIGRVIGSYRRLMRWFANRAYRGGRCNHWITIKNPDSPAMKRAAEVDWSRRWSSGRWRSRSARCARWESAASLSFLQCRLLESRRPVDSFRGRPLPT